MKIALALLVARAAAYAGHSLDALVAPAPAPAPAPGPAAGPGAAPAATLAALRVSFEIQNYNYYDLTRKTCPEGQGQALNAKKKKAAKKPDAVRASGPPALNEAMEEMANDVENVANGMASQTPPWMKNKEAQKPPLDVVDAAIDGEKAAPPPWMEDKEKKSASLLEKPFFKGGDTGGSSDNCVIDHSSLAAIHSKSNECQTIMDVFRSAIKEVVRDVIECTFHKVMGGAAGPVAPAPASFLQAPAPAAAAAPVPAGPPDVSIFVTFSPGPRGHHGAGPGGAEFSGRTINVEITFTDNPENGVDDVASTNQILQAAIDSHTLKKSLSDVLLILTNIKPKLGKIKMKAKPVEAWNVKKCEGHVKSIVENFALYYTRERVPEALFNECTNFMTRMSFSHDYVLDRMDTFFCRKTTAQFAKHWNFGEKAKPKDFELMCVRACEAKFGKDAPQCNVESGDALAGKPLL